MRDTVQQLRLAFSFALLLLALVTLPGVVTAQTCVPPPAGLVGWWRAEGNADDVTGTGNGTLTGNTSFGPGIVGQSFAFGTGEDGVLIGSPSAIQLQDFTIETWIERSETNRASYPWAGGGIIFGYGFDGYAFGLSDNGQLFLTQPGLSAVFSGAGLIGDTNWHHVAVTKVGAKVAFFIDGATFPAPAYNPIFKWNSGAAIGISATSFHNTFLGSIDELTIYNRALEAAEISSVFNAGGAGKCTIAGPPVIVAAPTNQTVTIGNNAALTLLAGGLGPFVYQWQLNGTNVAGATNSTLTIVNLQATNAGAYEVLVSTPYGSVTSSRAQLVILPPACRTPAPGLVSWWKAEGTTDDAIGGNSGVLTGNAGYGPGLVGQAFEFHSGGDGVIIGNPTNLQSQDFTIEAWIRRSNSRDESYGMLYSYGQGGYGLGVTSDGQLFLGQAGNIGKYVSEGQVSDTAWHHVSVARSGTNVVFYVDGMAYPSPSFDVVFQFTSRAGIGFVPDSPDLTFLGSIDELSVYNRALTSAEISGIYNARNAGKCDEPPSITSQSAGQNVPFGNNATFNVVAVGNGPLMYQWRLNGTNIYRATNATLVISGAQIGNAGAYDVVVSNAFGSATSSIVQLSVSSPVCTPLVNGLVSWWSAEGSGADTVGANTGTLTGDVGFAPGKVGTAYVFGQNGGAGGVIVPNSPALQLQDFTIETWVKRGSITNASSSPGGGILFGYGYAPSTFLLGGVIAIAGSGGYAFSMTDDGHLELGFAGSLDFAGSKSSFQITDANWHHLAVTKSGSTVQFYSDGLPYSAPPFPTWIPFQFLTNAAIGIGADSGTNGFIGSIDELSVYNRPLTAIEIAAIYNASSEGKCTIGVPPVITTQPARQSTRVGNGASFSVAVSGIGTLAYQWQFNGTDIAGATNSTFRIAESNPSNSGNYVVRASDAFGSVFSASAVLTVNLTTSIQPPAGLVSWWPANESTVDVAGGNNGRLTGKAGFVGGKVGVAFSLNGNEDGVVLGNPTNLQLQDFTIETWVKRASITQASSSPGDGTIFAYGSDGALVGGGYNFGMSDEGRLYLSVTDNFLTETIADSLNVMDTDWHHIAVTKSGTDVLFYLDGSAYTAPPFTTTPFRFVSSAAIGIRADTLAHSFLGSIDELSIYKRALAPDEVLAIYNASKNGKSRAGYLPPPRIGAQPGPNFTASSLGLDSPASSPSANGAVGQAHFVEFINGRFSVYDKATGENVQTMSDTDFWSSAGISLAPGMGLAGPRLIYDASSQRWLASQIDVSSNSFTGSNHFLLAVSASSDPTGLWTGVSVVADPKNGNAARFPTMGLDSNGVYLAADLTDFLGNGVGSTLTAFPKSALLGDVASAAGLHSFGPLNYVTRGRMLQPAATAGSSIGGEFVLSVGDLGTDAQPHASLFRLSVGNVTPATALNATLTTPAVINVPAYTIADGPHQPDGSTNLDLGDTRFSGQVYRIGDVVYATHNVKVNQRAAVEWYLINALNGAVLQTGRITDPNLDLFYPSIAANTNGTVVIACNGSSTNTYVSCYATVGQTTNGILGFGVLQLLKAGNASYQVLDPATQKNRWGDYSATTVDPVNPSHFWTIQLYPSSTSTWSTQITELITDPPSGPPPLTITSDGFMLTISWPVTSAGYILQFSSGLPNSDWETVAQAPVRSANLYTVTMPFPASSGFFRLINP